MARQKGAETSLAVAVSAGLILRKREAEAKRAEDHLASKFNRQKRKTQDSWNLSELIYQISLPGEYDMELCRESIDCTDRPARPFIEYDAAAVFR